MAALAVPHLSLAAPRLAGKRGALSVVAQAQTATIAAPSAPPELPQHVPGYQQHVPSRLPSPSSLMSSLRELGEWTRPSQAAAAVPEAFPLAAGVLGPGVQDVAAAVALAEGIYRADDHGEQLAEEAIQRLLRHLPAAPRVTSVQWSPAQQEQR